MITWCATGHRPDKLGGYDKARHSRLHRFACWYLEQHRPNRFISGMALGWDQACAQACISLGIPFEAAVPFRGQESKWPAFSQGVYQGLLSYADTITYVDKSYNPAAMQRRNEYMVLHSEGVVALWDGSPGGTGNCIRYAREQGAPIVNLWPWWETFT